MVLELVGWLTFVLAKGGVNVVLYEKEDSLGGHAKTVNVDGVDVDLGFMVFNRVSNITMSFFLYDSIVEHNTLVYEDFV